MFISEQDSDRRITSDENLINKIGAAPNPPSEEESAALMEKFLRGGKGSGRRGRKHGHKNLSSETRAMIAVTAKIATGVQAAEVFGVDPKSAYDIKQGFRHQNARERNIRDNELVDKTKDLLGEVHETAADRLMTTLGLLDEKKLKTVNKATDLSRIARDLATIVDKSKPASTDDGQHVHFHVYKPEQKDEAAYETIETS